MIAAIYSRKSRLSEKGESTKNQIEMCKSYGRNLGVEDFIIYEDEGFSGGNTNRPQFKKLINDAKKKRFDCLICYKLDRISRNVADFATTIKLLEKYDVNFISVKEQFDTNSIMGRTMMNITATFAQMEREVIAERIKDQMAELSKSGRWLGGTPPLGYKSKAVPYESNGKTKNMYKLTPVNNEIAVVKEIFNMFLIYKSCSPVSRILCTNNKKGKNGGDFSRNTVLQIIRNPVYCIADENIVDYFKDNGSLISDCLNNTNLFNKNKGLMVYNKRKGGKKDNPIEEWIISLGEHEGIISSNDWIMCQRILEENLINNTSKSKNGSGKKFLLSGLIKCGKCGRSMCSWSGTKKSLNKEYKYRYYRCELRNRAVTRCNNKMLNADVIEDFILDYIYNFDICLLRKSLLEEENPMETKSIVDKEISSLIKTKNENKALLSGLVKKLAIIDDFETLSIIKNEMKSIKSETDDIEKQINTLRIKSYSIEDNYENKKAFLESFSNIQSTLRYAEDIETQRSMIASIIESITYDSDIEGFNIKLRGWNFHNN